MKKFLMDVCFTALVIITSFAFCWLAVIARLMERSNARRERKLLHGPYRR